MPVEGAVWVRSWKGGRVRLKQGREVFIIERSFAGRRFAVTLDVTSERSAEAELALFERDPGAYQTKRAAVAAEGAPVVLDVAAVAAHLKRLEVKGCAIKYRTDARRYLSRWSRVLGSRDLRGVTGLELRALLGRDGLKTARKASIIHIKSFCSALREDGRLSSAEDPAIDLKVPPSRPEKATRTKGYSIAFVESVYAKLYRQDVRDVLRLRATTGMHHSEIERLAVEGQVDRVSAGTIAGVAQFVHKSGRVHKVSLDQAGVAALERLRALKKKVPRDHTVRQVIGRSGVKEFNAGELRHSFATWSTEVGKEIRAKQGGVPVRTVAAVMGHRLETNLTFYNDAVPPMIVLPLRLQHPDDPSQPRARCEPASVESRSPRSPTPPATSESRQPSQPRKGNVGSAGDVRGRERARSQPTPQPTSA